MISVVLGGAGFLGSHICDALITKKKDVVAVDDLSTGRIENIAHLFDNPRFKFCQSDISESFPELNEIETIFNFASPASPPSYLSMPIHTLKTGSIGTLRGLEIALQSKSRFVMASTSEVYGDPLLNPQAETYWGNVNPIGERSCYDEAKRFSEALCFAFKSEHDANIGVLRIFNTYGPRLDESDGRVVSNFIHAAINNNPLKIYGSGMQTRSLCFVSDLVTGILGMAESTASGPINLGNPNELTVLALAQKIIELTNSNSELHFLPALSDDPQQRCPDISKAMDILKWKPETSLDKGLDLTIDWFSNKRRVD